MKKKPQTNCDLNQKTWLNLPEAIVYIGFGSKETFKELRKTGKLPYHKPGREILYKRSDLDKFMEKHRVEAFA